MPTRRHAAALAVSLATFAAPALADDAAPSGTATAVSSTPIADDITAPRRRAENTIFLKEISVYSTRTPEQVLDVPANVTVIPGERIERQMITDMQELVRNQPGIDVDRQTSGTDPFNTFGGFTIRGVGGNRVQMIIDGSRVPERITDGTRDYLDFDFIDQAEIIRGPGSVLYGSDALGGIVALETVDPEDILETDSNFNGRISSNFDSFDRGLDNALTLAARAGPKVEVLAGISYDFAEEGRLSRARADGGLYGCPRNIALGATPCNKLDPTKDTSQRFLGKAVIKPHEDHRLELSADHLDRQTDVEFNQVLGPQFSAFSGLPTGVVIDSYDRQLDRYRQRFALEHQWTIDTSVLDRLKWTAAYAPQGYERSGTERRTNAAGEREIDTDVLEFSEDFYELDVQANSSFTAFGTTHEFTYGFDGDYAQTNYRREDRVENLDTGDVNVTRAGGFNFANANTTRADAYVQDEIGLFGDRVRLLPGVRFAYYSIDPNPDADYQAVVGAEPRKISSTDFQFKFGATVDLDDNFSVYGQYAEGFKMPTSEQLFTSLPGTFFNLIPAPDLKPEEVTNYEIGVRGSFERGGFSVNGFYAEYTDFIQSFFNPPGTNNFTFRNISEVTIYGIEASGEAAVSEEVTLSASLAWQHADQVVEPGADEVPFDVAPLMGTAGVSYMPGFVPGLRLDAIGTFADSQDRQSRQTLFKPDGFAVFDTYASYDITDSVRLTAAVLNLTDERYFQTPFPNAFEKSVSDAVARTNPLELQTAPGRTFRVGIDVLF